MINVSGNGTTIATGAGDDRWRSIMRTTVAFRFGWTTSRSGPGPTTKPPTSRSTPATTRS